MSSVLVGPDDEFVKLQNLYKVGKFRVSARAWYLYWSIIPLNSLDFSEELNRQVREAGGDAVCGLKIGIENPSFPDEVGFIALLSCLPVWPGSVRVEVEGAIVCRRTDGTKASGRPKAPRLTGATGSSSNRRATAIPPPKARAVAAKGDHS